MNNIRNQEASKKEKWEMDIREDRRNEEGRKQGRKIEKEKIYLEKFRKEE